LEIRNASVSLKNEKLAIKPQILHSSILSVLNELKFENVKSHSSITINVAYDAVTTFTVAGSNTMRIQLTLNTNDGQDVAQLIQDSMRDQMENLNLQFKCIVKLTLSKP